MSGVQTHTTPEIQEQNVSRRSFLKQLWFAAIGTALGASSMVWIWS